MALSSKTEANVPAEAVEEVVERVQVSFDDIECEAEYVEESELDETKKFYTISGKESQYEPTWEKYNMSDLDVGAEMEGRPEITIFENEDKTYDALRLRIMDDGEILDLYINYPKKHYPFVRGINNRFDFYRKCFDFIFSVRRLHGDKYVVDKNGEEVNRFNKINIEMLAKFVDQHDRIGVKIIEGVNPEYNSWIIYKLE